jgi:ABC-type uncharacterized transport system substrate-binding protein
MVLCLLSPHSWRAQTTSDAQHVFVVIRSSDAGPYTQAQQAAVDELRNSGRSAIINPSEDKMRELRSGSAPITFLTIGQTASVQALQRKRDIDTIVYTLVVDPDGAGLTSDNSVSGISSTVAIQEQIHLMRETLPTLQRIGYLYRSSRDAPKLHSLRDDGLIPGEIELVAIDLDAYTNSADAIADLFTSDVDFVWTEPDSSIFNRATIKQVLLESIRNKVPVLGFSKAFVKAGALLGYSISPESQGQNAAQLAIELAPSDRTATPIHSQAQGVLVINRVVARTLNVHLPRTVAAKAQVEFE